jgi:hypothetical protein
VTALPKNAIAIGPEMLGIGLSLANIAMADTQQEVEAALTDLWSFGQEVRRSFEEAGDSADTRTNEAVQPETTWSPRAIREAMEVISRVEEGMLDLYPKAIGLLQKQKFRQRVDEADRGFTSHDLERLFDDLYKTCRPALREARLALILEAGRRAKSVGVEILPDDTEAFKQEFRNAAFAETMSWQETAHLAASPANAKRISDAIASKATDRTEDLARHLVEERSET